MRSFNLLLFLLGIIGQSSSQTTNITIKAGEGMQALNSHVYRYPQFVQGKVYFEDGTAAAGKMNLNFFSGAMQFINAQGDTLAIEENNIRLISIKEDTFFFSKQSYLELVEEYRGGKLAILQTLKLADEKSTGAYGISSSTHRIDNYNTLRAYAQYTLQLNKDLIFSREKHYYFSYGASGFLPVNRKNVLKAFSKQRTELENYLEQHRIDLNQEEDVRKMFAHFLK